MPRKKRKLKKRLQAWHLLLLFLCAYVLYSFGSGYLKLNKLNRQYALLKTEKQNLQIHEKFLLSQHKYVESMAFIELTARRELGLIKPGEYLVVSAKPGDVKVFKKKPPYGEIKD